MRGSRGSKYRSVQMKIQTKCCGRSVSRKKEPKNFLRKGKSNAPRRRTRTEVGIRRENQRDLVGGTVEGRVFVSPYYSHRCAACFIPQYLSLSTLSLSLQYKKVHRMGTTCSEVS
jgi:hypothetical protein